MLKGLVAMMENVSKKTDYNCRQMREQRKEIEWTRGEISKQMECFVEKIHDSNHQVREMKKK